MGENELGAYLRDRRTKLEPAALGFSTKRRRTAGLRREEVAQRASISATWYTWLEQGRGGSPSADVLERIALALMMTEAEREHLFLLALGHPPALKTQSETGITPRLQRLLDSMEGTPAMIKTCMWDIVAWNKAASAVFFKYEGLPPEQRNTLRLMFLSPDVRAAQADWESVARYVVETFRADATRAGRDVTEFVSVLSGLSPDFKRIWNEHNVRTHGEAMKTLFHPAVGKLQFDVSSFIVDGRPDLSMAIYVPVTQDDKDKIASLIQQAQAVSVSERLGHAVSS
jgi:transcriptional regulator with XRE-family HTH domain